MHKYFKPALKMEAFDIEDVITLSLPTTAPDEEDIDLSAAPIDVVVDFN